MITTCKGRLHHLKQTLPLMVAQHPDELVVVDYNCPDGTGDWVAARYPDVTVVRVPDGLEFSASHARNVGVAQTNSQWLAFVDADIRIDARWSGWMRENLVPGKYCRPVEHGGGRDLETFGTSICARSDFDAVGGFDEALKGWSGENFDFFSRLADRGLTLKGFPSEFIDPIRHGDEERASFEGMAGKDERILLVVCYTEAKRQLQAMLNRPEGLSFDERVRVRDTILEKLKAWHDGGEAEPLIVRFAFDRGTRKPAANYTMKTKTVVAFEIDAGQRGGG